MGTATAITYIDVPASLDSAAIERLRAAVAQLPIDTVAVLRGDNAETFCSGMHLAAVAALSEGEIHQGLRDYAELLFALRSAPCPVIAAVQGTAYGGGVGLIAACDVVLSAAATRFGLPEATYGFYPAIVFAALSERIPAQKARLLALQCESIDAPTALIWGLIDSIIADNADFSVALQCQVRRLRRAAPSAVAALKRHQPHLEQFRRALDCGVEQTCAAISRGDVRAQLRGAELLL